MENEGDFILVDNFRWGFHRKSAISWERHVQLWSGIPRWTCKNIPKRRV